MMRDGVNAATFGLLSVPLCTANVTVCRLPFPLAVLAQRGIYFGIRHQ